MGVSLAVPKLSHRGDAPGKRLPVLFSKVETYDESRVKVAVDRQRAFLT
jgi:hypothetical protein